MIPRLEFHAAMLLAIAAAQLPHASETPIDAMSKPTVGECVCFDFWPGDSLRIVGTNGRRLAVTYMKVPGCPKHGKFLMPLERARKLLEELNPLAPEPISLQFFGLEQMLFTGSPQEAVLVDRHPGLYPEYHLLVEGKTAASLGAVYDLGTLKWVLDHASTVGCGAIQVHIREHGATTFRPKLHDGMQAIYSVMLAVKPFATYDQEKRTA